MFAIAYTKPGTTLTFWLNKFSWGGLIWSLVRSKDDNSTQRWSQPPLRFTSQDAAQVFIANELANNPDARIVAVED